MEEVQKVLAHVEVELFGEKKSVEPTFEVIALFEEMAGTSILDPSHWSPSPKLSSAAILLWAAIGGRKSGKTVKDVASQMSMEKLGTATALAIMVFKQYQDAQKKDEAAG